MKKLIFFFFFLTLLKSFAQKELVLIVKNKDSIISTNHFESFFVDTTRKLTFKEVKQKIFFQDKNPPLNLQAVTWYKLKITPKVNSKYIVFSPNFVPKSEVYIPYKNKGYHLYKTGFLNSYRKIKHDLIESVVLSLNKDSIDFNKPFYYNKYPISFLGKKALKREAFINFSDDKNKWLYSDILTYGDSNLYKIVIGIIFLSSLIFLLNFIVLKDKNFLNYAFYLIFTSLIFAPNFPIFYNFLSGIFQGLPSYINRFSVPMTATVYFYFVTEFVEVKKDFPKIKKIVKFTVFGSFIFALFKVFQHLFSPFFLFRFEIVIIYNVLFLLSSIIVFGYLISKKLSKLKQIVVFGSLLLIVGQILSLTLGQPLLFLLGVLLEILVFSMVVSLQNKERVLTEAQHQIKLSKETEKRKNLLHLDQLKTHFITNLSHELRTPLTLISVPVSQLEHQSKLPKIVKNNIAIIKRNTHRLIDLVGQLLDISKLDAGKTQLKIKQQSIHSFIENILVDFSQLAKQKTITFKTKVNFTDTDFWFDKDVLEKIISNLLSNAIKYTPLNGKITIKCFNDKNTFVFKVKNSGSGLSKNNQKKIFERFYQLDEHQQGAGIGLSLVKELVNLHKGNIKVDSELEKWTCFKINIPIDKALYIGLITFKETINEQQSSKKTKFTPIIDANILTDKPILLIVEDNVELRNFIIQIFQEKFQTIGAENGEEGIAQAIKHIPDIIISDIMMPKTDGITLCKTLQKNIITSHIPILLLTAKAGTENELIGFETGAIDYITKPFNTDILQLKIQNIRKNQFALQKRLDKGLFKTKELPFSSLDKAFIESIKELLEDQLIEPSFSAIKFSESLGMSRMQLHRKLKAITGLSATEFIRSQRLKLAAELLKKSDVSISEIAYSVGFNNAAYFTKIFKQSFGCTPSEFIEKL